MIGETVQVTHRRWRVGESMGVDIVILTAGLIGLVSLLGWLLRHSLTQRTKRREEVLRQPFPPEWETILLENVAFFRGLDDAEKQRFRQELQIFISEKRISGIKTEVDETTRVLVACSAIIPIFGFPEWEWDQIREVLVYPTSFNEDFEMGQGAEHDVAGMVGSQAMNGMMVLSKPDLLRGFRNPQDGRNVGIHEFAHLVDKSDGVIDGIPAVGLGRDAVKPWIELIRKEMDGVRFGRSDIDTYALKNEAEFFAVVSEYFFERPAMLRDEHPELYAMLAKVFRQDLRARAVSLLVPSRRRRRRAFS